MSIALLEIRCKGLSAGYSRLFQRDFPEMPKAWRIGIVGCDQLVPIAFERESDARRALNALFVAGVNTPRALLETGAAAVERIIAESQQW